MGSVHGVERLFTIEEARALMPQILEQAAELIEIRAQLAEGARDQQRGVDVNLADLKATEAHFAELLDGFRQLGLQVKGWAPLLLDFPSLHDGREVLLCWVEGEPALDWYHDADLGFAGRRPIADLR